MFAERMMPKTRGRFAAVSDGPAAREATDLMSKPPIDIVVCDRNVDMVGVANELHRASQSVQRGWLRGEGRYDYDAQRRLPQAKRLAT